MHERTTGISCQWTENWKGICWKGPGTIIHGTAGMKVSKSIIDRVINATTEPVSDIIRLHMGIAFQVPLTCSSCLNVNSADSYTLPSSMMLSGTGKLLFGGHPRYIKYGRKGMCLPAVTGKVTGIWIAAIRTNVLIRFSSSFRECFILQDLDFLRPPVIPVLPW